MVFFLSSIKLQYSRPIVLLKKLKPLKKTLFQKRRWSCDFLPRKAPLAQKHHAISRQEKMAFSTPVVLSWDSPPTPAESVRAARRLRYNSDSNKAMKMKLRGSKVCPRVLSKNVSFEIGKGYWWRHATSDLRHNFQLAAILDSPY